MKFEEETIDKTYVYKGKILNLRRDEVRLPNGETTIREVIEHTGGSSVLCEMDGKILLVRQFRYPFKKEIWEIPAGKRNKGESPETTAIRELEEEGGIVAQGVEKLFEFYPSPAYTEEIIYVFRAVNPKKGNMHLDEDEFLTCRWFSKKEIKTMLKNGEICDAKTLMALNTII